MKTTKSIEEILNIEEKKFRSKSKLFGLLILATSMGGVAQAQSFVSGDFTGEYHFSKNSKLCVDKISYDGLKPKKYDFGPIQINYDCNGDIISSKYKGFQVPKSKYQKLKVKAELYYKNFKAEILSDIRSKIFLTMLNSRKN